MINIKFAQWHNNSAFSVSKKELKQWTTNDGYQLPEEGTNNEDETITSVLF